MNRQGNPPDEGPLLRFPARYPFKIMARTRQGMREDILAVFEELHGPIADRDHSHRASSAGNYLSVTVTIEARDAGQVERIGRALQNLDGVVMVL